MNPPIKNTAKNWHTIVSYGIILFTISKDPEKTPKFLVYQRRDNYEYIDILRGNWHNEARFRELFSVLSEEEKERIQMYTFEELWDDLWINHTSRIHTDGYEKAKKKYASIKPKIPGIINNKNITFKNAEPPWGFPKGKKIIHTKESDVECALREFGEEMRLPTDELYMWEVKPFYELYKGNNNKSYSTHYFLAEVSEELATDVMDTPQCIRQTSLSEEAEQAKWMTYQEACLKLNPRRQMLLKKVSHLIETKYEVLSPLFEKKEEGAELSVGIKTENGDPDE